MLQQESKRDVTRLTECLTEYLARARAADDAADRLMGQSKKVLEGWKAGETPLAATLSLHLYPQVTSAREAWLRAANSAQAAYHAWLVELNRYVGLDWADRLEVLEVGGWWQVVQWRRSSFEQVTHRGGELVRFHTRIDGVHWLQARATMGWR